MLWEAAKLKRITKSPQNLTESCSVHSSVKKHQPYFSYMSRRCDIHRAWISYSIYHSTIGELVIRTVICAIHSKIYWLSISISNTLPIYGADFNWVFTRFGIGSCVFDDKPHTIFTMEWDKYSRRSSAIFMTSSMWNIRIEWSHFHSNVFRILTYLGNGAPLFVYLLPSHL